MNNNWLFFALICLIVYIPSFNATAVGTEDADGNAVDISGTSDYVKDYSGKGGSYPPKSYAPKSSPVYKDDKSSKWDDDKPASPVKPRPPYVPVEKPVYKDDKYSKWGSDPYGKKDDPKYDYRDIYAKLKEIYQGKDADDYKDNRYSTWESSQNGKTEEEKNGAYLGGILDKLKDYYYSNNDVGYGYRDDDRRRNSRSRGSGSGSKSSGSRSGRGSGRRRGSRSGRGSSSSSSSNSGSGRRRRSGRNDGRDNNYWQRDSKYTKDTKGDTRNGGWDNDKTGDDKCCDRSQVSKMENSYECKEGGCECCPDGTYVGSIGDGKTYPCKSYPGGMMIKGKDPVGRICPTDYYPPSPK
mmetsp:Transcript_44666/g.39910  ORF Transcript_44666/g.39910 Transcript_44666/m.39910 type:complete len:353 (-) Transcript_44666:184-1242(-)